MRMEFDSQKHHRHSIRIKDYDYAQPGGYFVTIVTYQRDCLFGETVNEQMQLNEFGCIATECWQAIPEHFQNVELGAYVIMPNHVHGIIVINDRVDASTSARRGRIHLPRTAGAGYRAPPEHFGKPVFGSIPTIIRTYTAAVTRRIGREFNATGLWQRNYYEHVIRNHEDWDRIHRYIESNPSLWAEDDENPTKYM